MKFSCLGYADERLWDAMSESEREAMIEECFAYDDVLRRGGHWTGVGEALQGSRAAKTLGRRAERSSLLTVRTPKPESKSVDLE